MKRRTIALGVLALVAMLVFTGCQQRGQAIPSDPIEAVKLIADKQKEITSQHLDLTIGLTIEADGLPADDPANFILSNFEAEVTAAGDIDNTNENFQLGGKADLGFLNALLSSGGDDLTFDLVKVGDTMYTRALDQDWMESEIEIPATSGADAASLTDLSRLLKKVATAERLGDESIDGVDSYHFKVTLDPVELINEVLSLSGEAANVSPADLAQATELLKDTEIDFEMWIGKEDLYIRQQKIHLKLDLKNLPDSPGVTVLGELNITTKNSKINEPVNITAPK